MVWKPRGKHWGCAKTVLSTLIHKDWLRLGTGPCMDAIHESTTSQRMSSECLPGCVAVSKKEVPMPGKWSLKSVCVTGGPLMPPFL